MFCSTNEQGKKWSLQGEADAVARLGCTARDREKKNPKPFSPEPWELSSCDFTHDTALVLMLMKMSDRREHTTENKPEVPPSWQN